MNPEKMAGGGLQIKRWTKRMVSSIVCDSTIATETVMSTGEEMIVDFGRCRRNHNDDDDHDHNDDDYLLGDDGSISSVEEGAILPGEDTSLRRSVTAIATTNSKPVLDEEEERMEALVRGWQMMVRLFEIWDLDKSGALDQEEIFSGVSRYCALNDISHNQEETLRIFNNVDNNQDRELDQREFAVFLKDFASSNNVPMDEMAYILMVDQLQSLAQQQIKQELVTDKKNQHNFRKVWGFVRNVIQSKTGSPNDTEAFDQPSDMLQQPIKNQPVIEDASIQECPSEIGSIPSPSPAPSTPHRSPETGVPVETENVEDKKEELIHPSSLSTKQEQEQQLEQQPEQQPEQKPEQKPEQQPEQQEQQEEQEQQEQLEQLEKQKQLEKQRQLERQKRKQRKRQLEQLQREKQKQLEQLQKQKQEKEQKQKQQEREQQLKEEEEIPAVQQDYNEYLKKERTTVTKPSKSKKRDKTKKSSRKKNVSSSPVEKAPTQILV